MTFCISEMVIFSDMITASVGREELMHLKESEPKIHFKPAVYRAFIISVNERSIREQTYGTSFRNVSC